MEILSFVLGMSVVVVIAVSIVAVIGFVKARKLEKEIESIHTIYSGEFERVNRDMTDFSRNMYSNMDSRLDKLEQKLSNKK